eukprot:945621-Prymnesium_polylepis.1
MEAAHGSSSTALVTTLAPVVQTGGGGCAAASATGTDAPVTAHSKSLAEMDRNIELLRQQLAQAEAERATLAQAPPCEQCAMDVDGTAEPNAEPGATSGTDTLGWDDGALHTERLTQQPTPQLSSLEELKGTNG